MRMPGLNDMIGAHWTRYAKLKKKWGQAVVLFAREQSFRPISEPSHFKYELVEADRGRDPSNVAAGAVKIIEDALQEAGLLKNDGWGNVLSIACSWTVGPKYSVTLTVS